MTTGRCRAARAIAVSALAILNLAVLDTAQARVPARTQPDVLVSVVNVDPLVPQATATARPIDVQLRLVNTTGVPIDGVRIVANRGDPVFQQGILDASLAEHDPSGQGLPIPPDRIQPKEKKQPAHVVRTAAPVADLPGDATPVDLTFSTTTSTSDHSAGICLCTSDASGNGVYPLHFRAVTGQAGGAHVLGGVTTYLPSITTANTPPIGVSWVWPLIDRPHRLVEDAVFTDDDLADSVGVGGRLSRSLAVVEDVGADVPITLLIDPELLDELEVMKTGRYGVRSGTGQVVPGRGAAAASAWLDRLGTVLRDDPEVAVQLTPYADPDFDSLTRRGLTWTDQLPAPMADRVLAALGGRAPQTDLAWPASGRASAATLEQLSASGVTGVLLGPAAVSPKVDATGRLASVAHVRTSRGTMAVGLTSRAISQDAGTAMGPSSASVLPDLIAEMAIRVAGKPPVPAQVVVIRAPRDVDPSPIDAAAAIRATSNSRITEPISLHEALYGSDATPMSGEMTHVTERRSALPPRATEIAGAVTTDLPAVSSLLGASAAAKPLLNALPLAVQRLKSSAWQQHPEIGQTLAEQLSTQVNTLLTGVHIVKPRTKTGSYTLASGNSPLPITVQNDLQYAVQIEVHVSTVNGLTGFTQLDNDKIFTIDPTSKASLHIASKVEPQRRIQVQAQLLTPNGAPLGSAVPLSVRSTALGVIGVVITIVAGAVLLIALLVRYWRRVRRKRRQKAKTLAPAEPAPVP